MRKTDINLIVMYEYIREHSGYKMGEGVMDAFTVDKRMERTIHFMNLGTAIKLESCQYNIH